MVLTPIVTPEGFPLAYEVMAGHTADTSTLAGFLARIEALYGKAKRTWARDPDRGDPGDNPRRHDRGAFALRVIGAGRYQGSRA